MEGTVKLSVIVPVYNGEAYIDRALDSILCQTEPSLEVVVINDGSKDGSLEKLRSWEKKDSRVKVIDKKNEGVSIARNEGMKMAKGTYLTFLDVDDYIEKDAYFTVLQVLEETKSQACLCSFWDENDKQKEPVFLPWSTGTVLDTEKIWEQLIPWMIKVYPEDGIEGNIFGSVWRVFVRKDVWEQTEVYFDPGLKIAEDFDFCVHLFSKTNRIAVVKEPLYHYIRWEQTTLSVYRKNHFKEGMENQRRLKEFLIENGKYEQLKKRFIGSYVDVCIGSMVNFVRPGAPSFFQCRRELKAVLDKIAEDEIYQEIHLIPLTKNQKLVLNLMKKKRACCILLFTKLRQIRKRK